ncbi:hypothetical protein GCM10010412_022940 [Nonomuraea recticatena]|uniref:Uncharacterized protein n=2 Tax=Nonomuraea recticatena TaxID=46178 RepID=A0ABN3RJN0_9ACTN
MPLAVLLVLIMIPVRRDNARLDALYDRALNYPLPPKTRNEFWGDGDATIQKNMSGGSGDYCDYRVRITLHTSLTEAEIRRYYSKAKIAGAERPAHITLWFAEPDERYGRGYILEVYDSHDSDWDWRCAL